LRHSPNIATSCVHVVLQLLNTTRVNPTKKTRRCVIPVTGSSGRL